MIGFWERSSSEEVENASKSRGRRPTQQIFASEGSTNFVLPQLLTRRIDCIIVIEVGELRCGAGSLSDFFGGLPGHA